MNDAQLRFFRHGLTGWLIVLALYGALHSYMPSVNYWHVMTVFGIGVFWYGIISFKEVGNE
jgi:hypothetical protein